jgi:hypothetical protein
VWPNETEFSPTSYADKEFDFGGPNYDVDAYCADAIEAARLALDS